ncbi:MAG: AgmX/PglI C-terminal domain-containing protein [Pseudobdellovibrionaceae bacterium]
MKNNVLKAQHKSDRRPQDFMLTLRLGAIHRKIVWNDHAPLLLDHPQGWTIARMGGDVCIYDTSDPDVDRRAQQMIVLPEADKGKTTLELPPSFGQNRSRASLLTIQHLEPIQPPYKQVIYDAPGQALVPRQLLMYQGVRYFLLKYRPIGKTLTTRAGTRQIFKYDHTPEGYIITPLVSDLQVKHQGKKGNLHIGIPHVMDEKEFFSSAFIHGINWWRFRSVITPDALPPLVDEESETDAREAHRVSLAYKTIAATLALLFIASIVYNHYFPPEAKLIATKVELKTPKVIPHKEIAQATPTPTPAPTPLPLPPPKPEPPKQEVVKEKPKKPAPEKKIVKKEPPKPEKKVAKKEPPPKPKKIAKTEPVPLPKKDHLPPPVKKSLQPDLPPKAGIVAKKTEAPPAPVDESAQLAKSLSFLSSGAKSPKKGGLAKYEKSNKKEFMNAPSLGGSTKDSGALDNLSSASTDTNIKTRSSRSIATDAGFDSPKGKGLNDVQGKVSLTQLYAAGSMEGFEEGTSIALSGPGELSESEIEKALAKFLAKFQFCYEKALLTDSSLAGNIRMQWTIGASGKVSETKVINSQMKNAGLHSCIQKVLKEIPFPHPKGGTVTAKKTFSFKSSAL